MNTSTRARIFAVTASFLVACGGASPPPSQPPATSTMPPVASSQTTSAASPAASSARATTSGSSAAPATKPPTPIDPAKVTEVLGGKPDVADGTVKVSFPRDDVPVEVDGWKKMAPFMGLTSWAGFAPGQKPGVEAMVMGDLVVFEDEVNAVMSAALDNGLEVTALHNHFFFDKPHVYFMHIGGEGTVARLAAGVKAALDAEKQIRQKNPHSVASSFGKAPPSPSKIDGAKLDAVFGVTGTSKDGMYKATFGRKTQAECGCTVGKSMGVNTWAAFGGTDADAVVDGDFAVAEGELQLVLTSLRSSGISIVAIHSHMTGESPRILFLHYWGRGAPADLASKVKRALDLTAWDGKSTST